MSKKDENKDLPYVDTNSGASPQPGAFVAYGENSVMPEAAGSDTPQVPDNDPEFEAKQGEASKAEDEGDNPNADGQQGETETETPANPAGEEAQGGDNTEGGEPEGEPEPEEKDYSELLEKNVPDVQKYLDEHPDEAAAVKAAEEKGKARAGVLDHG